jgi:hypothetical protein
VATTKFNILEWLVSGGPWAEVGASSYTPARAGRSAAGVNIVRLDGEVRASGAKNAALPIMAATLLAADGRMPRQRAAPAATSPPPWSCSAAWARASP